MQSFVGDDQPWEPYCDPCGVAMASVIKDCSQKRDAEIRRLPDPPTGKAAPKVAKPKVQEPPKPEKPSKGGGVSAALPPATTAVPKPAVDVRPRMSLAEAMRPTAPRTTPVTAPVPPTPVPATKSPKSAKNALREAVQDVEGYDLLTMLGMKR